MSIPLAMSPVGYDTWVTELRRALITYLGTFNLEADYLPDEKKLVVHTDRVSDEIYAEVATIVSEYIPSGVTLEQYNHNMEISWRDINKYAECVTVADIRAVNPNYKKDLTSDGEWIYPLPNLKNAESLFNRGGPYKKIDLVLPNATNCHWILAWATCDEITLDLPKLSSAEQIFRDVSVGVLKIKIPKTLTNIWNMIASWGVTEIYGNFEHVKNAGYAFASLNNRILRVLDSDWSSLSSGSGMFWQSTIHKDVALRVLTTIPAYTSGDHPLTLGIHIDHKYDPEVNTALKRAGGAPGTSNEYFPPDGVVIDSIADDEYKGWTLTVEWNGKATADAYPAPTTT